MNPISSSVVALRSLTLALLLAVAGQCVHAQIQRVDDEPDPEAEETAHSPQSASVPGMFLPGVGRSRVGSAKVGEQISRPIATPGSPGRIGNQGTTEANRRLLGSGNGGVGTQVSVGKATPSQFQLFVRDVVGKVLPVYGSEFFAQAETGGARTPMVPADYPIGPGDELLVKVWGSVEIDHVGLVDRTGGLSLPQVGVVQVQGTPASKIEETVRNAVGKIYRNFQLSVSLGKLRGISVYVVGQAKRPGSYSLSSISTLVDALFQSGGPGAGGGVRRVQVLRGGKVAAELDLYGFLAHGDGSANVRLLDGDVIVIPPAAGFVALTGMVERPAIYELRGKDTLRSILSVAGGLPVLADPRKAYVESIAAEEKLPRSVREIALDDRGLVQTLKDGDLVSIRPVIEEFSQTVTLRVSNDSSIRVPFRAGMRLTDVIPNRAALITPESIRRVNNAESQPVTATVGNAFEEINWDYAAVERRDRKTLTSEVIPVELGKALDDPNGTADIALAAGDKITVFSARDIHVPIGKRNIFVRVEGEVKRPGIYQVKGGETLANLILSAGGLTSNAFLFGAEFYRESVKDRQAENMNKLLARLEQQSTSLAANTAGSRSFLDSGVAAAMQSQLAIEREARAKFLERLKNLKPTGRLALPVSPETDGIAQLPAFRLEPGDRLVIKPRPDFVQLLGAVNTESAMLWQSGRTVGDYLEQAGLTADADRNAIFVLRANGEVAAAGDRWLSSILGAPALPGDTVVVPEKTDREGFWAAFTRGAKDWTQIFSNLGLGAAAIKTLRD